VNNERRFLIVFAATIAAMLIGVLTAFALRQPLVAWMAVLTAAATMRLGAYLARGPGE